MKAQDLTPAMVGKTITIATSKTTATGMLTGFSTDTIRLMPYMRDDEPILASVQIQLADATIKAAPGDEVKLHH